MVSDYHRNFQKFSAVPYLSDVEEIVKFIDTSNDVEGPPIRFTQKYQTYKQL